MMSGSERQKSQSSSRNPAWLRIAPALDGSQVFEALARNRGTAVLGCDEVLSCSVDRVHFGSQLGVIIDYELEIASRGEPARSIRAFGQIPWGEPTAALGAASRKLERHTARAALGTLPPQILHLRESGILFRPAGIDERVEGLALLAGPNAVPQTLVDELAAAGVDTRARCTLLAHRLGKRAVLGIGGCTDQPDGRRQILKLYKARSGTAASSAGIQAGLSVHFSRAGEGIGIPVVQGILSSAPGFVMEHAAGSPMSSLGDDCRLPAMASAGAAAAILHAFELGDLDRYGTAEEVALLQGWIDFVSGLLSEQAPAFSAGLERVRAGFQLSRPFRPCPIHRDFHERQLLWNAGSATLLDFDTVRLGDPAQDIGNFLAHLKLSELLTGERADRERTVFLEGYARADRSKGGAVSEVNVAAHERATLLRLALINYFSERRRHVVGALLDQV